MSTDEHLHPHLNLNDIAQLSGVSRSTVSRVVNNHPNVSERTRRRVLAIIEQYNYHPNTVARALVSQRSKVIGIIVPHIITEVFADPFFAMVIQSITTIANETDYGVTLGLTSSADNTNTLERIVNDPLLDGIIIAEASIGPDVLRQLSLRARRFLLVGRPPTDDLPISFVDHENEQGGYMAAQYLIERGRKKIAFMPGREHLTSSIDRQNGYLRALQASGLQPIVGPSGDYVRSTAYDAMMQVLENQQIDAVFCASDMMAVGAIDAIHEKGRRIPEDIAVVGFDNATIATTTSPRLTTINQDVMLLGKVAAETLIGLIEHADDNLSHNEILPVSLIVRDSA